MWLPCANWKKGKQNRIFKKAALPVPCIVYSVFVLICFSQLISTYPDPNQGRSPASHSLPTTTIFFSINLSHIIANIKHQI